MYRPAWRMNQTGVASTGSRRQARKNLSHIVFGSGFEDQRGGINAVASAP